MTNSFTFSLSLLILILNGGLPDTITFATGQSEGRGRAVDMSKGEPRGSAWLAMHPSQRLPRKNLCCSHFESSYVDFQQQQYQRRIGLFFNRHRGNRVCQLSSEQPFWSAARLRGGEHLPLRDASRRKLDVSVKKRRSSTSDSPEGPRSLTSFNSVDSRGLEVNSINTSPDTTAHDATTTEYVSQCLLPTRRGRFRLRAYRHNGKGRYLEPVVMVAGDIGEGHGVPIRVHDQCLTSEVLGSMRCDCKQQLELALDYISEHGGCVIYMQQEGRGIGLANKIAAYRLQDGGLDTVDANRHLGFDDDHRSYEAVKYILDDMGIKSVKLMTNNPFKLKSLRAMGIKILSRIPMLVAPNAHSLPYLETKARRMSHLLHHTDDVEVTVEPLKGTSTLPVALPLDEVGIIRGGEKAREVHLYRVQVEGVQSEEIESGVTSGAQSQRHQYHQQLQEKKVGEEEEDGYAFGKDSVLAAIEAVREGKCVVVTDDENRENEGDLIFAAEKATEDLLAFTIRHTSGVVCASLEEDRLEELRLPQMVPKNEDAKRTAFTVTVDASVGTTTGISAGDRARTLRVLADSKATADDFNRPGHIFPLRYTVGGVFKRAGHTEAAVDLAKLAGLAPVGVLCEITTKDGKNMARVPDLQEFCAEHGLVLTSIQDLRCLMRERQQEDIWKSREPFLPDMFER